MGDRILSSLSATSSSRVPNPELSNPLQGLCDDAHIVSFVDDVSVEVITVTDCAEVELVTSTDSEELMAKNRCKAMNGTVVEESVVVLPVEPGLESEEPEADSGLKNTVVPEANKNDSASSQMGPHDCPDCKKKFKFASSLTAHSVIHTGERPHCCGECGRCFSFRQSLDRHRHTHKTGCKYKCVICGETFHTLSSYREHKQTHLEDGVYRCHHCNRNFNGELALARHLKTHSDDYNVNKPLGSHKDGHEAGGDESLSKAPEPDLLADDNGEENQEITKDQNTMYATAEADDAASELPDVSPLKVRTSGRKRKPTMKIQAINSQKRIVTQRQKRITKASSPEPKPLTR